MVYMSFKKQVKLIECYVKSSTWFLNLISSFSIFVPKNRIYAKHNFLLPHPGNGNIGDQAMLDSFVNYLNGNCVLIVENIDKFKSANTSTVEMQYVEIPNLIYGNFFENMVAIFSILRLSPKMKSLSIIGADVMDGHYNLRASINRLFLLRIINSLKIETRVTGFSWSPKANAVATKLLRKISERTQLYLRDPDSAHRLRNDQIEKIYEVADLAFLDKSSVDFPEVDLWVANAVKPIVIVNISGLGLTDARLSQDHMCEYISIVKFLKLNGFRILLAPHVFRFGDGDLEVSKVLFRSACTSEDFLIKQAFSPAQERHLLKSVSFVITGRMHVAVMALSVGKPAIAIETMGKVKGLFDLFKLSHYCVTRDDNFGARVIRLVERLQSEYHVVCNAIEDSLPEIRKLASLNMYGLSSNRTTNLYPKNSSTS